MRSTTEAPHGHHALLVKIASAKIKNWLGMLTGSIKQPCDINLNCTYLSYTHMFGCKFSWGLVGKIPSIWYFAVISWQKSLLVLRMTVRISLCMVWTCIPRWPSRSLSKVAIGIKGGTVGAGGGAAEKSITHYIKLVYRQSLLQRMALW